MVASWPRRVIIALTFLGRRRTSYHKIAGPGNSLTLASPETQPYSRIWEMSLKSLPRFPYDFCDLSAERQRKRTEWLRDAPSLCVWGQMTRIKTGWPQETCKYAWSFRREERNFPADIMKVLKAMTVHGSNSQEKADWKLQSLQWRTCIVHRKGRPCRRSICRFVSNQ